MELITKTNIYMSTNYAKFILVCMHLKMSL